VHRSVISFGTTDVSFLTNSMVQNPPKTVDVQPVNKFPTFIKPQNFITMFTKQRHWILSWATLIQLNSSQHIFLRPIIWSSQSHMGFPICSFSPRVFNQIFG